MLNKTHYQNKVIWYKDWLFLYKLIAFILGTGLLILGLIFSVFIEHWYVNGNDEIDFYHNTFWLANLDVMTSFWSVQTIVLVEIWFLFALIYHRREWKNKISNFNSQLNITIYITVTFIIFWVAVSINFFTNLNIGFDFNNFPMTAKMIGSLTHLIIPLSMIILFFIDSRFKNYKFKNTLVSVIIYPVLYFLYVLIRAAILDANDVILNLISIYPYSFLDFTTAMLPVPLYLNALLMICIFFAIFWIMSFGFISINKIIWKKKWKLTRKSQATEKENEKVILKEKVNKTNHQ